MEADRPLGGEVGVGEQLTQGGDERVARVVPIGEDRHVLTLAPFLLVSPRMGQISRHAGHSRRRRWVLSAGPIRCARRLLAGPVFILPLLLLLDAAS